MSAKSYYLSRNGEVSGPFSEEQFHSIKASGEFYLYEWYWDGQAPDWLVIPKNKPNLPPLPTIKSNPPEFKEPKIATPTVSKTVTPPTFKVSHSKYAAIVYDQRAILSGDLDVKDQNSAIFTSFQPIKIPFGLGEELYIDCLDEKNDKATKVKAKVLQIRTQEELAVLDLALLTSLSV